MSRRHTVPPVVIARLGLRLLRTRDRRRATSMLLVVLGSAIAAGCVLAGVAAFQAVDARADRVVNRAFAVAGPQDTPAAWVAVRRMPYRDSMVLRVDVAPVPGRHVAPPPGLAAWPEPGSATASPAVQHHLRHDPALASYVQVPVRDTVGAKGLRSPDELVVYRGVSRAQLADNGVPVLPSGNRSAHALDLDTVETTTGQMVALLGVFAVVVGLPLAAYLAVAARLSAGTRSRRFASLTLLGLPSRAVRAVNAVEVVTLSVIGACLALALHPVLNRALSGGVVGGMSWFPEDTSLTPASGTTLLAVVLIGAIVIARRVPVTVDLGSSRTRSAPGAAPGVWRLLPLAFGTVALVAQVVAGALSPSAGGRFVHLDELMLAAVLVTGAGLLLAGAPLSAAVGRLLHVRGRSLAARLGGARTAFDPGATSRLVAGLAIMVFALGVSIGQTRDARAVSTPQGQSVDVTLSLQEVHRDALASLVSDSPAPAMLRLTAVDPPVTTAAVLSCAELTPFLGRPSDAFACEDGATYLAPGATSADRLVSRLPGRATGQTQAGELPQWLAESLEADVLITQSIEPAALGQMQGVTAPSTYSDAAVLVFRSPQDRLTATLAHVYSLVPYGQPSALGLDPDSGQRIAMVNGFIRLAVLSGSLIALMALVAALVDRSRERRRADHELLAAGAPAALLRRVHGWDVGACVAAVLVVAAVTGVLGGMAWQLAGGLIRTPDWGAIVALLLATASVAMLTTAAGAAAAPRTLSPEVLRGE